MPPKRKSNGKTPANGKKGAKKARKESSSEHEHSASEGEETTGFDKSSLQRCVNFDFEALMNDPSFQHPEFVHTMDPEALNLEFYDKNGLDNPIHFRCDPKRIGMTLPSPDFSVDDVLELVGGNRMIEVVQVQNQGSVKMSLQEFINFYKTPQEKREVLYNVLSLEFSQTPLEDLVKSPELVRQIDWVGNQWPDALRQRWISFNGRDKKFYNPHHTFPKVQNYCLMSVANCYTDFHIDFSGTSVWYHVLKGRKVFWLIPPTETNFFIYQEFIKTVNDNAFFGKSVEKCHVAILEPGDTMLIPSGWIHAVYTPDDSLVFGGNFLHSQSCKTQLRVYQVENKLNITRKFRLPYNEELIFYVIADYVKQWTGREYVRPLRIEDAKYDYVGDKWKTAGGHHKKIEYSDYETGVELTNDMIKGDEESTKDEVKVIAMHAENSLFGYPMVSKATFSADTGLEEEADEDEVKYQETKEEMDARRDAEIDELANSNSLIFYKNRTHDFVRNKCVPDHKLPIGHEPPIYFNDDEISRISPRLLDELETLGTYIRRKARVEVAEGICQPASLINTFQTVLKKRRSELTGKKFEFNQIMPRRYTRSTMETGEYDFQPTQEVPQESARRSTRFKVDNFPDELLESEVTDKPIILPQQPSSGPLEYLPAPKDEIKEDINGFEEEFEEEYEGIGQRDDQEEEEYDAEEPEDQEEEEEDEYQAEEYTPTPVTRRSSSRRSGAKNDESEEVSVKKDKKEKMEKVEKDEKRRNSKSKKDKISKEKKKKERERIELESQLDAELRAAHGGGSSKSKKKKPEKPAFVGGLPTSSIQIDPVVSNPYNYDPRMEMMKLGTGQLKSAYRKTKNNVELHIEKNLYKIEPKRGSEEGSQSREQSMEPEHSTPVFTTFDDINEANNDHYDGQKPPTKRAKYEAISVDTYETPSSSRNKEHKEYRPSPNAAPTPSPSHHQKPKLSSPAMVSSTNEYQLRKHMSSERRSSDAGSAMKKGVYMPAMSRQDKMIAEGASAPSSRHSSISSERRPSFIPDFNSSRNSSIDTPYTPTTVTPSRSSWLPNTSSINRHSIEDDSPIDVVNDSLSPINIASSPTYPTAITPPPVTLSDLKKDMSNGRKSHSQHHDDGHKHKIPSKEAIAELKLLVGKLKAINDS